METTNSTKLDNARNDMGKGIAAAWNGNAASSNAIARIACNMLVMIGEGNGSVAFDTGDNVTVSFDAETLGRYARKTLPKSDADAKDQGLPTAGQMIDALAQTADAVRNAMQAKVDESEAAKKHKANPIVRAKHDAEAERLGQALNTLKAPIRRAMTLAAFVATSDAFDMSSAAVDNGKLFVSCDTGETGDDGKAILRSMAVTFADAQAAFKGDAPTRAPNGETSQVAKSTGVTASGDKVTIAMTEEAIKPGGSQRAELATALVGIAGLLSDMDTTPTANEVKALQRLYRVIGDMLDDDAIVDAMADEPTAAAE